ncbi:putative PD-(D/E)XK family protein DUF4420 [Dysgonomonas alginatilytica]|uniref:Putative PD-(D/E)XK family protein DUF4420 n=2 Tax=Dysgonomonas alginatilytica TaxID=1605892 RepID=A0A2V3PTR9_9BACT|nr:putative PD-(D/E)XK family protein DUF4420 [Dysgonomonas alginatilytica]
MKKIDYTEIWKEINEESRNNPNSLIARKILAESNEAVFIATDFNKNIRCLYIHLSSGIYINQNRLPLFRGLDIAEVNNSIGDHHNCRFLKISQIIPETENIFELFVSDICNDIVNLASFSSLEPTLSRSLNEWKIFFEKYTDEILPISAQQGLFGELLFLEDFILKKYTTYEAMLYWTGAKRTNHDFQLHNTAIEVKTSAGKEHKKIYISSEKQLDKTGLKNLFLVLYCLNIHDNAPDRSLFAKIESIRKILSDDSVALSIFDAQLIRLGYNRDLAHAYTSGFSITKLKLYEITEGFPSISPSILPDGIGDLKYSIIVSACGRFEINKSEMIKNI